MKLKPRAIPRIKLNIKRCKGEFVDGIYQEKEENKLEILAGIQPYNGIRLTSDRDLQRIKSSILLFSNDEFKFNDTFIYQELLYKIKYVDPYYLGKIAHFESIAFAYDEDFDK